MGQLLQRDVECGEIDLEAKAAEQRAAPRFTVLIRPAKIVTPDREYLCVIRDASESGISMSIFHPLPKTGSMLVELQNGDRYGIEPVWQENTRAGFRFGSAADVQRIIESPSRFAKRPVRINLDAPAEVDAFGNCHYVKLRDISQQGAKLSCSTSAAVGESVKLRAEGLRATHATVRWRRDGACGLVFEETFKFEDLARSVYALQESSLS